MFNFTTAPPLSLYVHLPWCVSKCPYCDFNSYALNQAPPEQAYIEALIADLDAQLDTVAGREIGTVFFGGGTPSLFSAAAIESLLHAVRARVRFDPRAEITLEANPGTFERRRFAGFRRAGVNRLSLGVQTLNDGLLRAIGRVHDRSEALAALRGAREAGFDNLNVDLMYGLPGQTAAQALADVAAVMEFRPEHVSLYHLTLEPQTRFYHQRPPLPDEDASWSMQSRCQAALAAQGYRHYEVSAYAQPGRQCRHNLNYWRFGDYLGIGAGAHGKLTDPRRQRIERSWRVKQPRLYMQYAGGERCTAGLQVLEPKDVAFEFMLNALRLSEGFDVETFRAHAGLEPAVLEAGLAAALGKGLLQSRGTRILATARGKRYLNDLLALFLPEAA